MAESKDKDTKAKKPAAKKPAAKKAAAKTAAKKPSTKTAAKKSSTAKKATATKKDSTSAAKATSKTTDAKASEAASSSSPARKAASTTSSKGKSSTGSKTTAKKKEEAPARPVVNASARFVRVAPRKARLIADQVRGLPLEDAQTLLRFSPRGAARDIATVLHSAAANAENNHDLIADELLVKSVTVDEGPTLRRYRPRALGRATKINKRTSHITVALTPEEG